MNLKCIKVIVWLEGGKLNRLCDKDSKRLMVKLGNGHMGINYTVISAFLCV